MSGRGCVISLEVVGNCGISTKQGSRCMSLPVALHSPLDVLKGQLEEITGIEVKNQVLILCDLSDPDRNNDLLLTGKDFKTLRECGIKNGSSLTLHPLGVQVNFNRHVPKEDYSKKEVICSEEVCTLETRITPAMADHSYNGIVFDMSAKGPFEVSIHSISVGGMLGVVRIFARDRPWEDGKLGTGNPNAHYWAYQDTVSRVGWTKIAEVSCSPSWDKPFEIFFDKPVTLLPHSKRGFYIHSGLPDDLGIQYQSYSKNAIVAEDDHITIFPGVGHTGSEPFDEQHGWYRSWRGPAGVVTYSCKRKGWHPHQHLIFPAELKQAVLTMLLVHLKGAICPGSCKLRKGLHTIPQHVLYYTMEFMHWDWFEGMERIEDEHKVSEVTRSRNSISSSTARSRAIMSHISSTTSAFIQQFVLGGAAVTFADFRSGMGGGSGGSGGTGSRGIEYILDDDDEGEEEDSEDDDDEEVEVEEEDWEDEDDASDEEEEWYEEVENNENEEVKTQDLIVNCPINSNTSTTIEEVVEDTDDIICMNVESKDIQ